VPALAQRLCQLGAFPFLLLGIVHAAMAAADLVRPRFFAPTSGEATKAMRASGIGLTPRVNVWLAWLGFNVSHGLGLLVFGGGVLYLATFEFALLAGGPLLPASVAVALVYAALAPRCWFYVPAILTLLGFLCLAGGYVIARVA
jgi:hypothetical protein